MSVRKTRWRRGVLSAVAIGSLVGAGLLTVRIINGFARGSSLQGPIWASGAIAILLVGLFGLMRFLVEARKGEALLSRLELQHPAATFGILRFPALREQLRELGGDVSGWDWMVLAAVALDDSGIYLWGGRATNPKQLVLLPWEQISAVEQVDIGVRAQFVRGFRVTVKFANANPVKIELAPVSFQDWRFRPLEDRGFHDLLARMREPLKR